MRARPKDPLSLVCQAAAAPDCRSRAEVRHHTIGRPTNAKTAWRDGPEWTLDVCDPCHLHIHAHPTESYDRGWMHHRNTPRNLP